MSLRQRRFTDIENGEDSSPLGAEIYDLQNRNTELEILVLNLRSMLDKSRTREKKLVSALTDRGGAVTLQELSDKWDKVPCLSDQSMGFFRSMLDRAAWLIGLLIIQSFSSFVLSSYTNLLQEHPSIVFFLTMLIGAGGNAGNQASVKAIRELALGNLDSNNATSFFLWELAMACCLSSLVGMFGLIRVLLFGGVSSAEAIAITIALTSIVYFSVLIGTLLPLLYHFMGIDPINSSTSIQVVMDVMGVLITCFVATLSLLLLPEMDSTSVDNSSSSGSTSLSTITSSVGSMGGKLTEQALAAVFGHNPGSLANGFAEQGWHNETSGQPL